LNLEIDILNINLCSWCILYSTVRYEKGGNSSYHMDNVAVMITSLDINSVKRIIQLENSSVLKVSKYLLIRININSVGNHT